MKYLNNAIRLALCLTVLLVAGCGTDDRAALKTKAVMKTLEACEPGNTATFKVSFSTWNDSISAECNWIIKDNKDGNSHLNMERGV